MTVRVRPGSFKKKTKSKREQINEIQYSVFEQRVNELEGGVDAVCCSSGMSAIMAALVAVCNNGDIRTLVIHPASTLYAHTSKEEMEAAGVYEDTIRVTVGIEDTEDLIEDFLQAVKGRTER